MMIRVVFLLALIWAPQVSADDAGAQQQLQLFHEWFAGEFDNNEQVWQQATDGMAEEDRHEHIHHLFVPVKAPGVGGQTYFVKQYMGGDYENVYRQRLYDVTWDMDEQAIRLAIYSFNDEQKYRYADKDASTLEQVKKDELRNMPGCDVFWTLKGDHFLGEMKPNACFYYSKRLGKNIYITDTLKLNSEMIWIGDKAFDEEGNKIFGRDEHHANRKVRYFKGWAGVRADRVGVKTEDPDETLFVRGIRLHNEGQKYPLVTKDGVETGYTIELARLTYQNTKVAVLKLGLIEEATGKTFTYTWTNPGADMIGINLRWMQVGLTAE